jgi:hypothetical protein
MVCADGVNFVRANINIVKKYIEALVDADKGVGL